jgi:hypothetical protein
MNVHILSVYFLIRFKNIQGNLSQYKQAETPWLLLVIGINISHLRMHIIFVMLVFQNQYLHQGLYLTILILLILYSFTS